MPARSPFTFLPSETIASTFGSKIYTTTMEQTGFYNGSSTLKSLVDAIRGPAERIVRGTVGQPFTGTVSLQNGMLSVGSHIINTGDLFRDLIATVTGSKVGFNGLSNGTTVSVINVTGTMTQADALVTFPSPGGDVLATLPAGTPVNITNLTLSGNYFEVTSGGQQGFVRADRVSIASPCGG